MKKWIAVLAALTLCLAFTGCRDAGGDPSSTGTEGVASSADSRDTSSPLVSSAPFQDESSEVQKPPVSSVVSVADEEDSSKDREPSSLPEQSSALETTSRPAEMDVSSVAAASDSSGTSSESGLETVRITFPEGTTVARISDLLSAKGVADSDSFFQSVTSLDVSAYPLAASIPASEQRCFRLEGYLFPDTYEFYLGEGAEDALKRMLQNSEKRIPQAYRERAAELGMTMDQALTLASIIQKEAPPVQMGTVSSVLHNRLNAGMRLQCDVTIKYVEGAIKPYISGDINRYNASYNTYKCAALPAGAICNPGLAALQAALWPEDTTYLYFAFDPAGNYYYSDTYEEHLRQCREAGITVETE